ncbi:MAG: hypothetical protein EOO77_23850 [Oxalobacteraceae bacterium]|nr:MAG: hypothetical protein EOO77_23850 [Oxalobacteraceae bacterium]
MRDLIDLLREAEDHETPDDLSWTNRLQSACDDAQVGFHYEEGGCWGMALALRDTFAKMGMRPSLQVGEEFVHAAVEVDGILYDWQGRCQMENSREVTQREFLRLVVSNGCRDDLLPDYEEAKAIIANAITPE